MSTKKQEKLLAQQLAMVEERERVVAEFQNKLEAVQSIPDAGERYLALKQLTEDIKSFTPANLAGRRERQDNRQDGFVLAVTGGGLIGGGYLAGVAMAAAALSPLGIIAIIGGAVVGGFVSAIGGVVCTLPFTPALKPKLEEAKLLDQLKVIEFDAQNAANYVLQYEKEGLKNSSFREELIIAFNKASDHKNLQMMALPPAAPPKQVKPPEAGKDFQL